MVSRSNDGDILTDSFTLVCCIINQKCKVTSNVWRMADLPIFTGACAFLFIGYKSVAVINSQRDSD